MNSRTSILIVEQEHGERNLLARRLLDDGYDVGVAENAADVIGQLQAEPWDIILLDINTPGAGGMELARKCEGAGKRHRTGAVDDKVRCNSL